MLLFYPIFLHNSQRGMVILVFMVGMHVDRPAKLLRSRDSEADSIVHEPNATQRRPHLSRVQRPERRLHLHLSR